MTKKDHERTRQIAAGVGILLALMLAVCGVLTGWRYLPGLLGEWVGLMVGVMTTPFLLEASFLILGLIVVVAINIWRQRRSGDELVYLEQVEGVENLPEHAKWALYRDPPLDGEMPSLQVQVEGALAIGDYESAAECIAAMPEADLKRLEILALRLELARATGRQELVDQLESDLRMVASQTR